MTDWRTELKKILNAPLPVLTLFREVSRHGVVLYGAGSMGEMALNLMKAAGKRPLYIVDRKAEGELNGMKIVPPEEIPPADLDLITFVVCIVSAPVGPIFDYLNGLGCRDVRHFYDYSETVFPKIMTNGWANFEPSEEDTEEISKVFKAVAHDDCSIAHYLQFLWWRLRRREVVYPGFPVLSGRKYFSAPSFPKLSDRERLVDGGAHFGATIKDFVETVKGRFDHIWAFEPDPSNVVVLRRNIDAEVSKKMTLYATGLYNTSKTTGFRDGLGYASKLDEEGRRTVKTVSLDSMPDISPTIIKLHIEGDELKALHGARRTIMKHRPVIIVTADHNTDGLYRIPVFLMELDDYRLFFNLHDYCGNSAIYYAYPIGRLK